MTKETLLNFWMTFISNKYVQHGVMALGVYIILGLKGLSGYIACALVNRMRHQDWETCFGRLSDMFQPWTPLF